MRRRRMGGASAEVGPAGRGAGVAGAGRAEGLERCAAHTQFGCRSGKMEVIYNYKFGSKEFSKQICELPVSCDGDL